MTTEPAATIQFTSDLRVCRLVNGLWQVSGGHGRIDPARALDEMLDYHDAGFTTWDLADHYGPAEELIGAFRQRLSAERGIEALESVQAFTKWVPSPGPMTRPIVEMAIDRSRRRMASERLDLLQFHWWDYRDRRYLDALHELAGLREAGAIRHLGLTNFDTARTKEIVEQGIPIVSNQVQFSLVDRRPERAMIPFCRERGIRLLPYGVLCGGFLSEHWIGRPEPRSFELETVSLRKYKGMIDAWGGWPLLQDLLDALQAIAARHGVSVANVAVRAILDEPTVAGVIIGTRLSIAEHRAENARSLALTLDDDDRARLRAVTDRSRDLFAAIGDCGDEYH